MIVYLCVCRILQISRPRLNYLIILGAVLFYISMLFFAIPTRNPSTHLFLSKTQPWTISLGFSLCYGTVIMKMFRVYYIVHNPSPNKVHMTCVCMVCTMLLIMTKHSIITALIMVTQHLCLLSMLDKKKSWWCLWYTLSHCSTNEY